MKPIPFLLIPILLLSTLLLACNQADTPIKPTQASATIAYKRLDKVDPNLLSLDIYYNQPTTQKKPVVIYVHGGGWIRGDKTNQLENKIKLFRELNYVFVSINYRLSPYPFEPNNPNRLMYPIHNRDVADAIKWVFDNISAYGGAPNKIALLGHSAGAHLVALTGTNATFLADVGLSLANIKGIAVIDTQGYDIISRIEDGNSIYINAFGIDSTLNTQASPMYNIVNSVTYPKFFIAKRGNAARIKMANNFIDTLEQNGIFVSQVDGSIYNHAEINQAIGQANETLITNALKLFFETCFR